MSGILEHSLLSRPLVLSSYVRQTVTICCKHKLYDHDHAE